MQLKIHCDGGARGNPGPAASAFVVYDETGKIIFENGAYLGTATNNQAEYQAVLNAITWLADHHSQAHTEFFLDSLLVASQLNGQYKIKNLELKKLADQIKNIIAEKKLLITKFSFVYRDKNFLADSLVNQTLDERNSA
ncbi:MAG: ribonuclease HI family protein [bacterium]|nr:ribonuclease HI family protein [bacterium]